jgi:hypothetical protein
MKKNELKKVLRPIIKECIKECIFEDGVLSGIISEVFRGLEARRVVTEGVTIKAKEDTEKESKQKQLEENYEKQRQERIKRLNESASPGGVNVFENVAPVAAEPNPANPLSATTPDDSGVNIDGILNLANGKWKQLI